MEKLRRFLLSVMLIFAGTLMSAQTEITGTVIDETGETVIGVTVKEKGTSNGVVTDLDGNFKLNVNPGATIVITYIGYDNVEVPATPGMTISLKQNASELAEVVVVGYQTQRKADLTGSVAVVKTEELKTSSDTDYQPEHVEYERYRVDAGVERCCIRLYLWFKSC